ncbi:MAG: VOC family protein [Acidiferrobacterales bacterium]|nr:VOC family protein [Acidiferrobacterales bacterium]
MKRFHIHIGVDDLERSISFYSQLFGEKPTKVHHDYAKWLLDDPRVNFAISTRVDRSGVDHLGIQVDEEVELDDLRKNLKQANVTLFDEGEVVCCYSHSAKSWLKDPAGIAWEAYHSMGDANVYSRKIDAGQEQCCAEGTHSKTYEPDLKATADCCS